MRISVVVGTLAAASCPSRGTWIEIPSKSHVNLYRTRRAPRGARGLKYKASEVVLLFVVVPLAGHVD